jgi:hypothetical protein
MLIDGHKLSRLVENINKLIELNDPMLAESLIVELASRISSEFDKISGTLLFDEDITNYVMDTDLLTLIGKFKDKLKTIHERESLKNSAKGQDVLSFIKLVIDNNPCDSEFSNVIKCEICDGIMVYDKKFLKCNSCDMIKYNDTDNFNIDCNNTFELNSNSRNSNIIKHLQKNLSHIYGESWPDKLPEAVSDIIIDEIRFRLPNLIEEVHPSYQVHELLHNMRLIFYEGKIYKPKDYKIFTNSFIIRAFSNIHIPKLESEDDEMLNSLFLTVTAKFLDIITKKTTGKISKYNNNYLFTIHRILFMKLYHKEYIRSNLLRFIYIQNPSSFKNKDKKLRKVDSEIRCFDRFYDTPVDIYIEDKYYFV